MLWGFPDIGQKSALSREIPTAEGGVVETHAPKDTISLAGSARTLPGSPSLITPVSTVRPHRTYTESIGVVQVERIELPVPVDIPFTAGLRSMRSPGCVLNAAPGETRPG